MKDISLWMAIIIGACSGIIGVVMLTLSEEGYMIIPALIGFLGILILSQILRWGIKKITKKESEIKSKKLEKVLFILILFFLIFNLLLTFIPSNIFGSYFTISNQVYSILIIDAFMIVSIFVIMAGIRNKLKLIILPISLINLILFIWIWVGNTRFYNMIGPAIDESSTIGLIGAVIRFFSIIAFLPVLSFVFHTIQIREGKIASKFNKIVDKAYKWDRRL